MRVLYSAQNPALVKLQQNEREFSFTDPRLRNDKPYVIAPTTSNNPGAVLADKTKAVNFDLYVLSSSTELPSLPDLNKSLGDPFTICNQAVAYIPEWVNEERREGAARFLQYLSTHCR